MRARLVLEIVFAIGGAVALVASCADDEHKRTSREQAIGGGGPCEAEPGEIPAPNCDNSQQSCEPSPGCTIDEAHCGSKSTCLPMGENKGKDVLDFRIRRLNIATPAALAGAFIQKTVIDLGIDLNDRSCGELGKGLFSWLLRVDKTQNLLVTGGAPPPTDPFGQGFCFARFAIDGQFVQPIQLKIAFDGSKFSAVDTANVRIPIFLTEQLDSAILLPISDAVIKDVTISDDGDCIGQFRPEALDPSCIESRDLCTKWVTAGSIAGFITLDEADGVKIRDLNNKSLCAFLSGDATLTCARDASGHVAFKGNYCSQTKAPGGCQDSVWLAGTFAASAAKIFDGRGTVEGCSGTAPAGDGGVDGGGRDAGDAGAPSDAGLDGG